MKHIIVDVRESDEFNQDHASGAINIPLSKLSSIDIGTALPDKNAEIILYCNSGSRSALALQILKQHGYTNLTNGINIEFLESLVS